MAKVQTLEILDIENVKIEKMRYQKNGLAYMFGLIAIFVSIFASFVGLNSLSADATTFFAIALNIIIFLFGFLACEKVKVYKKSYSYVMLGLAITCIARIFWAPLLLISRWKDYKTVLATNDISIIQGYAGDINFQINDSGLGPQLTYESHYAIIPEGATAAEIEQIKEANEASRLVYKGFLSKSGYFRAALMIALLVIAAVLFAFAFYIGYTKTKKLEKYLQSINVDINKR